ncbi:hypothetical protein N7522_006370 [Penicillium canescens]|nr:hypothetical protein N7522_006370 [Penicillium canescens]
MVLGNLASQAGIYQSKHAPLNLRAPRSEPANEKQGGGFASSAIAPTDRAHRTTGMGERRKTTTTEDSEVFWNPPPSSSSALAERDSNGSLAKKATRPVASGNSGESFGVDISFSELSSLRSITNASDANTNGPITNTDSNE